MTMPLNDSDNSPPAAAASVDLPGSPNPPLRIFAQQFEVIQQWLPPMMRPLINSDNSPPADDTGSFHDKLKTFAQSIEASNIHYSYAVVDSLSSSYSMARWAVDLLFSNKDVDLMHDLLLTPEGMITAACETIFLVGFAVLANRYDDEADGTFKKNIALLWPYMRTIMKGLKNGYKGWKSTVLALHLLESHIDLHTLIAPVGLILGIFAALNRVILLSITNERKKSMKLNKELALAIQGKTSLRRYERQSLLIDLYNNNKDAHEFSGLAFGVAAMGGLLDGLYLYVGVLSLATFSSPVFLFLSILCVIYTIASIITRIYEEYNYQLILAITETKCRVLLLAKELQTMHDDLLRLEPAYSQEEKLLELKNTLRELFEEFEGERALLQKQSNHTYLTACLLGMKNGLYAYSALASILFVLNTCFTLAGVAFPPLFVVVAVSMGLVFVIGFLVHAIVSHSQHLQELGEEKHDDYVALKTAVENDLLLEVDRQTFSSALDDALLVTPSPLQYFQDWFEVIRSFFSGLGKGQKFFDFIASFLQELGPDGHYHDTPVMFGLAAGNAALFSLVLGLRAFAKGLGRKPPGKIDIASLRPMDDPETPLPSPSLSNVPQGFFYQNASTQVIIPPQGPGIIVGLA